MKKYFLPVVLIGISAYVYFKYKKTSDKENLENASKFLGIPIKNEKVVVKFNNNQNFANFQKNGILTIYDSKGSAIFNATYENGGQINQIVTAVVTAIGAAIVRAIEKRRLKKKGLLTDEITPAETK